MAEHAPSGYQRLFEVRLLHHYWLDDGAQVFDKIADNKKKNAYLLNYDRRSFLAVRPTNTTEKVLSAYKCLFKENALGFVVAAPTGMKMPADAVLEFIVTATDARFYEYTALTLRAQSVYEFFNELDKSTYRFKENVPVLSNLTGTARGTGVNKALYLSRDYQAPGTNDWIEGLVKSGSQLMQLTSDAPGATMQQLGEPVEDWPVFLHQGDFPAIAPHADLSGVPERGVRLSGDMADDVFAYLSLVAVRPDDAAFSFVDDQGRARETPPVYQIRFRSRSTSRRYLDKTTGAVTSEETNYSSMTYFGNAGTKQKPSDGLVKVQKSGTKITRLISEIYI